MTFPSRPEPGPGPAGSEEGELPAWLRELDLPVWVSGPDRRIHFFNEKAEMLFGRSAADTIGQPCHGVIASRTIEGAPFCADACPLALQFEKNRIAGPISLRVARGEGGEGTAILVVPIPLRRTTDPAGFAMVHCAVDVDRWHRIEEYVSRVATRTRRDESGGPVVAGRSELTRREKEVLEHLARDEDLFAIAAGLHISYVTVRNHVRHILSKMGAHSTQEATARYFLGML